MMRKLAENLKRVQQRIAAACDRAGRDPAAVSLVAVTKNAGLEWIRALVDLGVQDLGENRVLDVTRKAAMVKERLSRKVRERGDPAAGARWHMIGHLQRNKVKAVLPWIDLIHSVDTLRLAEEIDAQSAKLDRKTAILLEVNAAGEASKQGVAVPAASHLAEQVQSLKYIELRGLMAMAPLTDDVERIRRVFGRVRELFDEIVAERMGGRHFAHLSLGMTNDFEYAIEAGATYVRIGSALFEGLTPEPESLETVGGEDDEVRIGTV